MSSPFGVTGDHDASGSPSASQHGINLTELLQLVADETIKAKDKVAQIKTAGSAISIGDMFEVQMLMNHLSQMSEMSTAVVAAAHGATMSAARNVK